MLFFVGGGGCKADLVLSYGDVMTLPFGRGEWLQVSVLTLVDVVVPCHL